LKAFILALLLVSTAVAQERPPPIDDTPPKPPYPVCPQVCPDGYICTPKPAPESAPILAGIKWHPGHYAETQTYGTSAHVKTGAIPASVIADIANVPAIRGVTQRYNWSAIEPEKGKYDFRVIEADLAKLRPHKKRLIVLFMDRSWSDPSKEPSNPKNKAHLPAYLGSGIVDHPEYGHFAAIWTPQVMDRLILLDAAMAKRFDDEPLFEGMRYEEITAGLTAGKVGVPKEFSVAGMIHQWERFITAARWNWKSTNVFLNTNTLGGITGPLTLIEKAWHVGLGVGGPDVIPPGAHDYQIAGDRVIQNRPDAKRKDNRDRFRRDYRGEIPISHSVQTSSLGGKEGTFTPKQLADYAIGQMGDTHMSWVVAPSNVKINWRSHILPYLKDSPRSTVQACPRKYTVGCVTE
jgi:hypothetical protein